jgi:hypothetical protein
MLVCYPTCADVPPDVAWLGPLAGCGGWLGTEMDPPFGVVGLLLPVPPGALVLPVPRLAELLLLARLPGEVVAWAG